MLRLPPFGFVAARTLDEALGAWADADGPAMYVAGGTDLIPNLKRRQFEPRTLVGIRNVAEMKGLAVDEDGSLRLGAALTLHEMASRPEVRSLAPGLAEAAMQVANPQIQRMGTLGGNLCVDTRCNYYNQTYEWRKSIGFCLKKDGDICLVAPGSSKCWAVSSSDTAPALIAMGAHARLVGPDGAREVPVAALYRDDGIDYMTRRADEILVAVRIPPAEGRRSAYAKVRRRGSFDFPILGVGAAIQVREGVVRGARLVLGAVHTHPVDVPEAAEILEGQEPVPELLDAVADAAHKRSTPLDNTDLTLYWRKRVTRVTVRRTLDRLLASG